MARTTHKAIGVAATAGAVVLCGTIAANAVSYSTGNYGSLPHEGAYPNGNHVCGGGYGWYTAKSASGTYGGRKYTVRLCYSDNYGAYGRLDGAAINDPHCQVWVDRTNTAGDVNHYATVAESVDSNVGYAYTKVANDLSRRLARAAVVCGSKNPWIYGGTIIARTGWY